MKIQTRILASSAMAIGFVLIAGSIATHYEMQAAALEQAVQRAVAVVGAAEEAREHVGLLHEQGAIDLPKLLDAAKDVTTSGGDYRTTPAFNAIPIVIAIEAAKGAAKSAGLAQVSAAAKTIATAVSEQRTATPEIAQNLASNTRTVEVVNRNVAECVTTSREISKSIQEVDNHAQSTASGADETAQSGKSLSGLANELQTLVGRFQV